MEASGSMLAGVVFKQARKMLGDDGHAPDATGEDRGWSELLFAAILQGAVLAGVSATVDRATRRLTGAWPG